MGEAKRRKEKGLSPKQKKKDNKEEKSNTFNKLFKGPRFGLYLGAAFVIYLIYDVIHYYTRGYLLVIGILDSRPIFNRNSAKKNCILNKGEQLLPLVKYAVIPIT